VLKNLPRHPNIIEIYGALRRPNEGGGGHEFLYVLELCSKGALSSFVTPRGSGGMPPQLKEVRARRSACSLPVLCRPHPLPAAASRAHASPSLPPVTHHCLFSVGRPRSFASSLTPAGAWRTCTRRALPYSTGAQRHTAPTTAPSLQPSRSYPAAPSHALVTLVPRDTRPSPT
jgi:hypothetical protein